MPILDCLKGIIGIKGRPSDSAALAYVQSLPGISILDLEKGINNESRSAYARFDELTQLAINDIVFDVRTAMAGKFLLKSFIENQVIGYQWENQVVMPSLPGNLAGMQMRLVISPYTVLFIHKISLFVQYTGTVTVNLYDLKQNTVLFTQDVTVTDGIVSEQIVDWEISTDKQRLDLFLCYEASFPSYKTLLTSYTDDGSYVGQWLNSWIFVRGASLADGTPALWENLDGVSGTSGLSFSYSLQCSFDERLCNMKNMLVQPILYRLGTLILKEMKHSKRLNGLVVAYNDDYKELMLEYDNEYRERMNQIFANLQMPKDLCFECDKAVSGKVALP